MNGSPKTKIVIGCGYLGRRVAARWKQNGDQVIVGTRRLDKAASLKADGYDARVLDVTRPDTLSDLPPLDTLMMSVAFDESGDASRKQVHVDGLGNVLNAIRSLSGPLVYISTTGVYGQQDGSWVDERSPCEPVREGGKIYRRAERLLQSHRWGKQAVVLRFAGIYGPDRLPFLNRLQTGRSIPVDASGFLNLIHVDDAVGVILASERCQRPNLYVVSDGVPVVRRDYYEELGRRVGRLPVFDRPDSTSHQFQRAMTSKRVCNRKLLEDFRFQFRYPSYREGIQAVFASEPR